MDYQKISFIVPVLNAEQYLPDCLKHLQTQMKPGDELFIIDNGSTDRSIEIARSFSEAKVEIKPEITIAALRNFGVSKTSCDLLAFIDADCLLSNSWREMVQETLTDKNISATGALPEMSDNPGWVEKAWCSLKYREARAVDYLPSMNFVIYRAVFNSVNGFNENLITDEDSDICRRLAAVEALIFENPKVAVTHLGNPKTIRNFITKERWHASSIVATMALHGLDRPMFLTFVFIATVFMAAMLLGLAIAGIIPYFLFWLPLLWVPTVTVLYRVFQYRNISSAPALLILYTLFYLVRSSAILTSLFSVRKDRS